MLVYSKLRADNSFSVKADDGAIRYITIKGGAGVADKHTLLVAPAILSEISDADFKLLQSNKSFMNHLENGFIVTSQGRTSPEKVAKDMTEKADGSTPIDEKALKTKKVRELGKTAQENA